MKILLMLALVGVAVVIFLRRGNSNRSGHNSQTKAVTKKTTEPSSPYRATYIITGEEACEAVRALADKPFLDNDKATPSLPLASCTATRCRCRYAHRDDRRVVDDGERRFDSGVQAEMYRTSGKINRRTSPGNRRHSD